jgi:GT2 family glycosyltransferase
MRKHLATSLNSLMAADLPENTSIIVYNKKPFNFSEACNLALQEARLKGEDVILMNDDVVVKKDTIMKMLTRRDDGIIGAQLFYPTGEVQHSGIRKTEGGVVHYFDTITEDRECFGVTWALVLIPYWVQETVGFMDTDYKPTYWDDIDYCMRAQLCGIKCIVKADAHAIHFESITLRDMGITSHPNHKIFMEKWGEQFGKL